MNKYIKKSEAFRHFYIDGINSYSSTDYECNTGLHSNIKPIMQHVVVFWSCTNRISVLRAFLCLLQNENHRFNPACTDKYLFILPSHSNAKPMCLICNECVAVLKDYNVRRHHIEKHQTFRANFPEGSRERAAKVQSLIACYNRSCHAQPEYVIE